MLRPGWGGFFIAMVAFLSLVIVNKIDVGHVAIFKAECDPPVARNRNAPRASPVTPEGMQSVPRQIKFARLCGYIEIRQGESNPIQLVGTYPAGVASLIEPPQSSMAKRTDHREIIPCAGIRINSLTTVSNSSRSLCVCSCNSPTCRSRESLRFPSSVLLPSLPRCSPYSYASRIRRENLPALMREATVLGSMSNHSARRRSSIRRNWRASWASLTPRFTEPWRTCWPPASSGG